MNLLKIFIKNFSKENYSYLYIFISLIAINL